jgi:enoyl-CoA hydratase/carnithine racemase
VIVLTGVGRVFCAGADLRSKMPAEVTGEDFPGNRGSHEGPDAARQHFYHGFTKLHRDISLIRKPTVAMINGPAVGSGMDMALHCDIRIGCEKTRFIGYHNAGQIIENGGSYYLPKMVGLGRALEFAYTGELDAQRAYDWGMLNHLVPSDKLEETTRALCDRIIKVPPAGAVGRQAHHARGAGQHARDHHGPHLECRRYPERLGRCQGGAPRLRREAPSGVQGPVTGRRLSGGARQFRRPLLQGLPSKKEQADDEHRASTESPCR